MSTVHTEIYANCSVARFTLHLDDNTTLGELRGVIQSRVDENVSISGMHVTFPAGLRRAVSFGTLSDTSDAIQLRGLGNTDEPHSAVMVCVLGTSILLMS